MKTRTMQLVLTAATLVAATTAHAGELAAVAVSSQTTPRDQEIGLRAANDALGAASWSTLDKPLSKSDTQAIARCFLQSAAPRCALQVVSDKGVRRVAYISIERDAKSGPTSVRLIGRVVVAEVDTVTVATRYCDHCTDDTLAALVAEMSKELVSRASLAKGRTVLAVKSTPQGARFSVDGADVGVTDASIAVAPGPHHVRIQEDGFEIVERNITAEEGKTAEVVVTLRRTDGRPAGTEPLHSGNSSSNSATGNKDPIETPQRSRALPIALMAVGALAIVGGAIAIAIDEDDVASPRLQPQPQYYYDTTPAGIVAIGGGVVLAGIGGYLFWKYSQTDTTPTVTTVNGGAVVGVSTSF